MKRKRDRIFLMALGFSFVFHFSMVTLFRIVIYFPRYEQVYYRINLVESTNVSAFTQAFQPDSVEAGNRARFEGLTESPDIQHVWSSLPSVELPRLNFSKLELPRISRVDINTRLQYKEHFDSEPDDLWAQVGEKLSTVGELFMHNTDVETISPSETPQQFVVGQPAPGFEALLEWVASPYTRKPLLVKNVDALWGASAEVLSSMDAESLVLVFRVNRDGRVTFVQMPLADDAGVVESSAEALRGYRFTPLLEGPEEQHGVLTIRAVDEESFQ